MNYQVFTETMRKKVEELLAKEIRVELHRVTKNNGITLFGLCIISPGIRIMPTIYMEEFYLKYQQGSQLDFLAREVIDVYERSRKSEDFKVECFTDFSKVKDQIVLKLINKEKNEELLKDVPYIDYLDLAIVFVLSVETKDFGSGNILIHSEHLEIWKITKELLYEYAKENTIQKRPLTFQKMEELMRELGQEEEIPGALPMYVLSNDARVYGAAMMIYDRNLYQAGEILEDNYFILPSSIHEVILVPQCAVFDQNYLKWMVKEINATEIALEEVLSDNIYYYDREHHRLKILV